MKALKRWLGNETSEEESSDHLDEKWTEVERVFKKDKRKRREEEKRRVENETLRKGSQI